MLADELKKIPFYENDNMPFFDQGILLFNTEDGFFYEISFGDGTDSEPVEGCDDYLYIQTYAVVNGGEFEENDGGNMWFNRKGHTGYINEESLVRDALEFMNCANPDACIYLKRL